MFVPFIVFASSAVVLAVLFALYNFFKVKKLKSGTEKMTEIAGAISEGAAAFIAHEYKIIAIAAAGVAVLLGVVLDVYSAVAFVIGTTLSGAAGLVGMKIATIANVRVANTAREQKSLGKTLKVAFRGGSVMGLCVGGFAIFGLLLCFLIFGFGFKLLDTANITVMPNGLFDLTYIPFTMVVSCYALGCSMVALFNRIGGGIYTKAADMGADLVGKTEEHIPEDDPRNPATIADNVGDNVGDVAGLGSDLLESYVGAIIAAVVLAAYTSFTAIAGSIPPELLQRLMLFPVTFAGLGMIACVIGIAFVIFKKPGDKPHTELNIALWTSAALIVVGGGVLSYLFFKDQNIDSPAVKAALNFTAGPLSPWIGAVIGIVCGIVIGLLAEYYTSADYKPTQNLAKITSEGTALTITKGLALGMKSCFFPVIVLAASVIGAYSVAGVYGVTMAAVGMLSFVAATVSVDTYGPIADNAGGISEMSGLDPEVRKITDKLDSVGNTTAAIGKGFAIGSGALAALSLLISFIHSQIKDGGTGHTNGLDIINYMTLAGAFIGGALPFFFSGMLTDAVAKSARKMVKEVRRQFKEMPGILTGEQRPDYKQCIKISAAGAISEMKLPVLLAIGVPILGGFALGADFVGGILIGATITAIMLAIFTANAGGAWDNAKKAVEQGLIEGAGKGSPEHDAAVVGDTVGDPLKDTVGPSLDILIKIMATVSLIGVSIFGENNLIELIKSLIG
ncbi:MAG: sodium-translocating pyrophosphatase [Clostridiales bacterium]|jgi:K(+)-stimulated pyrophosphate-energized sodium pump|nr:sodium-translocating pyrophosphatase [Clostridiales bacterium]